MSADLMQTTTSLSNLTVLAEDLQAAISRFKVDASDVTMTGLEYDAGLARL